MIYMRRGAFEVNKKITVGLKVTESVSAEEDFTAVKFCKLGIFMCPTTEVRTGTCSMWGMNGYTGDQPWAGTWVSPYLSTCQEIVGTPDDMLAFRLGVLLYYQWRQTTAGPNPSMRVAPKDYSDFDAAAVYFEDLWKRDRMPLAGFMLADMYLDCHPGFVSPDTTAIFETLIKTYGGADFYRYYLNAKHNHWRDDPARAEGVPPQNQLPLSTALIGLYIKYGSVDKLMVVKDGKQTWQEQPGEPDKAAALRFLDGWVKNLWKAQHRPSILASSRH